MRFTSTWAALAASTFLVGVTFSGCDTAEEDIEQIPEVVEEEPTSETGVRELSKEVVIGPEDVGETLIATGWVNGEPLENGFFLRTEFDRLIFVETDRSVRSEDAVRVRGVVQKADEPAFTQWEVEVLGRDRDWDLWRDVILRAEEVTPFEGTGAQPRDSAAPRQY